MFIFELNYKIYSMKKLIVLGICAGLFAACGGGQSGNQNSSSATNDATNETAATTKADSIAKYDPHRGEGKFKDVEVGPFNAELAQKGESIYNLKCQACHKLSDERLVGPGWEGITKKHNVDWILNFLTNTDAMLDQDPELQKQIEICMVRMPDQNLTDNDAKAIYEFMRENDGAK